MIHWLNCMPVCVCVEATVCLYIVFNNRAMVKTAIVKATRLETLKVVEVKSGLGSNESKMSQDQDQKPSRPSLSFLEEGINSFNLCTKKKKKKKGHTNIISAH